MSYTGSKAIRGAGTVISIETADVSGTITYTQVAELKTFTNSGSKNDLEEVTNFDSTGRAKEYITTLLDSGEFSIAGNYIAGDAGQAAFRGAFNSGASLHYKLVLPLAPGQTTSGEMWEFVGIVQENDADITYDKAIGFSAKVKITGVITITPGA